MQMVRQNWYDCQLEKLSHYENRFGSVHRYHWSTHKPETGERVDLVYSGVWLGINRPVWHLRGTPVKIELIGRTNFIRIKRVKLIQKPAIIPLLL